MGWLILLGFMLLWLVLSIKIVGPTEMAVKVLFGKWVSFCESGFQFVPFLPGLKVYLVRYPKTMYNLDYEAREAITKAGIYDGVYYGRQTVKVDATAYLNFPRDWQWPIDWDIPEVWDPDITRGLSLSSEDVQGVKSLIQRKNFIKRLNPDHPAVKRLKLIERKIVERRVHPLIKILRSQIPINDTELTNWTEEAVVAAVRIALGQMTWGQAIQDMEALSREAQRAFRNTDGALMKAGFRDPGIRLVITEIRLPAELEKILIRPDQARLEADAAKEVARRRAIETVRAVVEMICQETGMKIEDVEKELKERPEEFIRQHQDIWQKNWDILHRRMGIDGGAYLDIRATASEPWKGLLDLLAAWQRMPGGGKKREAKAAVDKPPRRTRELPPELTAEEEKEIERWLEEEEEEEEETT